MSDRRLVVCIFTGGTISMLPDPVTGAARPALDGAAIIARTPGLDTIARVESVDWGLVPASHLSFDQILDIGRIVRSALARPDVAGAVVVQGTDVIEETAFAFELLADSDKPVVVVGAMRTAGHDDYDGPANLRDAVRVAADPALVGQGGVVVMAGRILPADDVVKTHTDALDTFQAVNRGPIGRVEGGRVVLERPRGRFRTLPRIPAHAAEPVPLISVTVATDGSLVRAATSLRPPGMVIAATGSGNTNPDVLAAAVEAMGQGTVVVHASRCLRGGVSGAYGFPAGGAHWHAAGAIPAGTLSGPKARIVLALGLGAGMPEPELRGLLADPEA